MSAGAIWQGIKFCLLAQGMVFAVLAILGGTIECIRLLFYRPQQSVGSEAELPEGREVQEAVPADGNSGQLKRAAAVAAALQGFLQSRRGSAAADKAGSRDFWLLRAGRSGSPASQTKKKRWSNG